MAQASITPRKPAPALSVPLVDGDRFTLADARPPHYTMVVFYRGKHCPICKNQLQELKSKLGKFGERGVECAAISMDTEDRAKTSNEEWEIDGLRLGYGLSEADAKQWGLFISEGIKDGEPDRFSEPGLFLIEPDNTLYYAAINSMPFGRPQLDDLLGAIDFVQKNDYPARGEAA